MTEVEDIPIEKLEADPANIRERVNIYPSFVEDVGDEVRQNLIVRPKPDSDKYLVTVGERRYKGAKNSERETLPCKIKEDLEGDFYGAMAESMRENTQREPIPKERWPDVVMEFADGVGVDPSKKPGRREIKERTGMSLDSVERYVKIAGLPDYIQEMTREPDFRNLEEWQGALLKKPSNRSDSEREALEGRGISKDRPSIVERSDIIKSADHVRSAKLSIGSAEGLARSETFEKIENKSKAGAFKTAIEGSEVSHTDLERVIDDTAAEVTETEMQKRSKPVGQERGSGGEKKFSVNLDVGEQEAAEEMMEEEGWSGAETAIKIGFLNYAQEEGYY